MFVEWQRRTGGPGTGFTLLGEDDHGGGGRKGVCVWGEGVAMGGKGGPKGEEDTLAFFVGLFSSLFKKKIIIICCLVIFISFLLLGIDVVVLGGKQSRQERRQGAGLPGELARATPRRQRGKRAFEGTRTEPQKSFPLMQNPLSQPAQGAPQAPPPWPTMSTPGLPNPGPMAPCSQSGHPANQASI